MRALLSIQLRPRTTTLLGVLALVSVGCGSSDAESFCTEQRDPLGVACDPSVERIDLQSAEALARAEAPEDAWLWQVRSSYSHVDPDGNATDWAFTYYFEGDAEPPNAQSLQVFVRGSEVEWVLGPTDAETFCIPEGPIAPFDSREIIQDSIRRIEATGVVVQIQDPDDLGLVQNHRCSSASSRLSGTWYRLADLFYYTDYDQDGQFVEVRTWTPQDD